MPLWIPLGLMSEKNGKIRHPLSESDLLLWPQGVAINPNWSRRLLGQEDNNGAVLSIFDALAPRH